MGQRSQICIILLLFCITLVHCARKPVIFVDEDDEFVEPKEDALKKDPKIKKPSLYEQLYETSTSLRLPF
jgi:hypothetical protein